VTVVKSITLSICCVFLSLAADAKVYKWVDMGGVTRYSNFPPVDQGYKLIIKDELNVGTSLPKELVYIDGFWSAKHNDQLVLLMFHKAGWFSLAKLNDNGSNPSTKTIYAGQYSVKYKTLTFVNQYTSEIASPILLPQTAVVIKAAWDRLILDWGQLGRIEYRRRNDINRGSPYKPRQLYQ
jgi:hypothetical protein